MLLPSLLSGRPDHGPNWRTVRSSFGGACPSGRPGVHVPRLQHKQTAGSYQKSASVRSRELNRFKSHSESIVRGVGTRLSLFLQIEFTLELLSLDTMTLPKFADSSPPPRHMILFKLDPLLGIGFLDVHPRLALSIADRMLGGNGLSVDPNRALGEIDIAVVNQMAQVTIKEWCKIWQGSDELRPILIGHESNPRFLQIADANEKFYMFKMEAGMGDCVEHMLMAMPVKMLDPLVRKLARQTDSLKTKKVKKETIPPKWNSSFGGIRIPLTAEWRELEIKTRDLLNFQVGTVIPFDSDQFDHVVVCLAGKPKYLGKLGRSGSKCAVEITELLTSEQSQNL